VPHFSCPATWRPFTRANRQAHLAENQTGIRQPAEILQTTVYFWTHSGIIFCRL
jgi:hypothetical protein